MQPQILPTYCCRQASFFLLLLPLHESSKKYWNFVFLFYSSWFYKFHMLLPFILSYLNCMTLREWSLFFHSLKSNKERIRPLGMEVTGQKLKKMEHLCWKKCLAFFSVQERFYCCNKQRRSCLVCQCTDSLSHARSKTHITILQLHISLSQQWAPHPSSCQPTPAARWGKVLQVKW